MSEEAVNEPDPREELAALVAATRALLEQYEASGADLTVPVEGGAPVAPVRSTAASATTSSRERPAVAAPPERAAPTFAAPPERAAPTFAAPPERAAPTFAAPPERAAPTFAAPPGRAVPPFAAPPERAARPAPPAASVHASPPHVAPLSRPVDAASFADRREAAPPPPAARPPAPPEMTVRNEPPPGPGVSATQVEGDDRKMRLALLAEEVRPCIKCGLCETRTQTVFSRGNPFAEVMFVGEGPGADEDAKGEPFVGRAGQLLDKMIAAMGYARDEVYIANIVKCRPPNNRKPEPAEMEACLPYLRQQIALVKPKVIVALGATAVTGLIGTTEGITRLRGNWKLYKGTIPIMPTFHPAYLLRQPQTKREAWSDLQQVMKHLGKPLPKSAAGRDE